MGQRSIYSTEDMKGSIIFDLELPDKMRRESEVLPVHWQHCWEMAVYYLWLDGIYVDQRTCYITRPKHRKSARLSPSRHLGSTHKCRPIGGTILKIIVLSIYKKDFGWCQPSNTCNSNPASVLRLLTIQLVNVAFANLSAIK